jgi:transposase
MVTFSIMTLKKRGQGSKNHTPKLMINGKQLLAIATHVNTQHSEGKSLTNKRLKNWLKRKHTVKVNKRTMGHYMHKLGLL